jgi:hypothetical protein
VLASARAACQRARELRREVHVGNIPPSVFSVSPVQGRTEIVALIPDVELQFFSVFMKLIPRPDCNGNPAEASPVDPGDLLLAPWWPLWLRLGRQDVVVLTTTRASLL